MADVNRGNRPLSPHLQVYRPQITSVLSIFHRMTGVAMTLGAVMMVWWLLAAATGPEYFAFVDDLLTSWIGGLVWIGMTWALCYHFCNGIRHLWWDTGRGFGLEDVTRSGQIALAASAVMTLIVILFA